MANVDECALWPLLCFFEFYRLDENDETGYVLSTCGQSFEFYAIESTFAPWDIAEGGSLHRELDTLLEAVAVQGESWDIESFGWA
jgi:hypothetical protein